MMIFRLLDMLVPLLAGDRRPTARTAATVLQRLQGFAAEDRPAQASVFAKSASRRLT